MCPCYDYDLTHPKNTSQNGDTRVDESMGAGRRLTNVLNNLGILLFITAYLF